MNCDYNQQALDKENAIFLLSWLSNINANKAATIHDLNRNAQLRLNDAFGNDCIQKALSGISDNPQEALVWGPVSFTNDDLGADSVTDNLMYVFKGKQPGDASKLLYVVAIAGTNPVSHFGWYTEDFDPGTMLSWPVVDEPGQQDNPLLNPDQNPYTTGKPGVALGFSTGLDKLWNHMPFVREISSSEDGEYILDFLNGEMTSEENKNVTDIEIAVAGHSLGGGLSPMLALALREKMNANGKNLTISAWPTAGPTPGEADFAGLLPTALGSENYNPAFNGNDVVPHGYQMSMLNKLCDIYKYLKITTCLEDNSQGIQANDLVRGLLCYIRSLPGDYDYQRTDDDPTFNDGGKNFSDINPITGKEYVNCSDLYQAALLVGGANATSLGKIQHAVSGNWVPPMDAVRNMLIYLVEAGYQHTDAYTMYYLGEDLFKVVHHYMDLSSATFLEQLLTTGTKGFMNFSDLLIRAAGYLNTPGVEFQDCQDSDC